ncbi:MAG: sulfurtransferase TusA family protein [Sphaerochaetaceae bacterium]
MIEVDARGLSCPIPVVKTKKALSSKPDEATVTVDNIAALENVTRYAQAMKYEVQSRADGEDFILHLTKK